jgi:hypothetical protein
MLLQEKSTLHPNFTMVKNSWIMWLFLPLSVTSIMLGIKYKNKGIACKKNIIGGYIVSVLLLAFGSFFIFLNPKIEFDVLEEYQEIIGVPLPTEGVFFRNEWGSSYLLEHITNSIMFTDKTEIIKFNENVRISPYWFLEEDNDYLLSNMIPVSLVCRSADTCYYSVYVLDVGHNILPYEGGKYRVFAMMYSINYATLIIEEYTLFIN